MRNFIQTDEQTSYGVQIGGEIIRNVDITVKNKIYGDGNNSEVLINLIEKEKEFKITKYSVEFQYSISSIKVLKGKHPNADPVTKKYYWKRFKKDPNVVLTPGIFELIENDMREIDLGDYYKTQL